MALTDRIRQTAIEVAKRMTRQAENDGMSLRSAGPFIARRAGSNMGLRRRFLQYRRSRLRRRWASSARGATFTSSPGRPAGRAGLNHSVFSNAAKR